MKKIFSIAIILFTLINISITSAQVGGTVTKSLPSSTYTSLEALLQAEGNTCAVATDGINSIMIENGKATLSTLAYPGENPEFSCMKQIEVEEMKMCTMQYDPVCGIDGKTYGNSCMAGNLEIAYQGQCEIKTMINENMYSKYENNTEVVQKLNNILRKTSNNLLERVVKVIDKRIAAVKLSRIAEQVQIERITKLTFIKDLIEVELVSK